MVKDIHEIVKEIKQSFRLMMNGVVANSMRTKGVDYKLNWGVSLPELKSMAAKFGRNRELATALWNENIRECKILATFIMPPESMTEVLTSEWMKQICTQEMAEIASLNLLQNINGCERYVMKWITSTNEMERICAFLLIPRLLAKGWEPNEREREVITANSAEVTTSSNNYGLRRASSNCMQRLSNDFNQY
jgi:3-methyladenine DNA glycosylase AlkD